jgi:hypothetical protein
MALNQDVKKILENATKQELEEAKWLLEHSEYVERPVDIETFVTHPRYLNLKFTVVGNRGYGCRPRILKRLKEVFDGETRFEEFVFMCGIGWGKDFASSIILTYGLYQLACLKDPQNFYGLSTGSNIHLMLMSISETHARDVLFGEIKARIDNSEWFQRNFQYNKKIATYFQFPKNIMLIPGNSKDTTFVGYNIFMGIIDEGDDYTVTKTRDDAEEGYNSIKDRIVSRFRNQGMLGMIGSAKTVDGFMMRKYENAEGLKNRYRIWVPTWDSLLETPILSGKTFEFRGLIVPIEYEDRFKSNPENALRDLACRPSLSKQPFITLTDRIDEIFDDKELLFEVKDDKFSSFAKFKEGIKGLDGVEYLGHADLAVNRKDGDKLGFALGHQNGFTIIDGMVQPNIRIDMAMVITAPPGGEILFYDFKQLVFFLQDRGFFIKKITSDSWNAIDFQQSMRSRGIMSDVLSMDRDTIPFDNLKKTIYEGRVKCHQYEHLKKELERLELINGERVDHPKLFSKDVADAVCGVVYNITKSNSSQIINFQPSFGGKRSF